MPPIYFFLIDVSHASVEVGMLVTVCEAIENILDSIQGFQQSLEFIKA